MRAEEPIRAAILSHHAAWALPPETAMTHANRLIDIHRPIDGGAARRLIR
jgi:hypothetical protein